MAKGRAAGGRSKTAASGDPAAGPRASPRSGDAAASAGPSYSGESAWTALGAQQRRGGGGGGGGDGGLEAEGATPPGIHVSGICNSSRGDSADAARAASHRRASTSGRAAFTWVRALLRQRLDQWDRAEMKEFDCSIDALYDGGFSFHHLEIPDEAVPHIIGRGGQIIRQIESVCGVFLTLRDCADAHEIFVVGPRLAIIAATFAIEMLGAGQHSVLSTLQSFCL